MRQRALVSSTSCSATAGASGPRRFVAGETLDSCVAVLRKLNDAGLYANTTLLGEAIPDEDGAAAVTAEYEQIIERLVAEKLKANVALKLTHLGLSFDEETAYANVARLVERAGELGTFVRIDMEQSEYVDATLRLYERLRDAGHDASERCCSRTSIGRWTTSSGCCRGRRTSAS